MILADLMGFAEKVTKVELLNLLKKEASKIHIKDIMSAAVYLRRDAKYMPPKEGREYVKRFTKAFFNRLKDLRNDPGDYKGYVDTQKLGEFLDFLQEQRKEAKNPEEICFHKIANIISVYTTFVREEPIHPVGTRFPGGLRLREKDGVYYCPVKEKQLDNPSALCRFCVSIQDKAEPTKKLDKRFYYFTPLGGGGSPPKKRRDGGPKNL